jgi:hypothetical protein
MFPVYSQYVLLIKHLYSPQRIRQIFNPNNYISQLVNVEINQSNRPYETLIACEHTGTNTGCARNT